MDRGEIYDKIQYSVMDIRSPNQIIELYMHQSKAEWHLADSANIHYANKYHAKRNHTKMHRAKRHHAKRASRKQASRKKRHNDHNASACVSTRNLLLGPSWRGGVAAVVNSCSKGSCAIANVMPSTCPPSWKIFADLTDRKGMQSFSIPLLSCCTELRPGEEAKTECPGQKLFEKAAILQDTGYKS